MEKLKMKKIMILIIAIFVCGLLVAEITNVTFVPQRGNRAIYHVLGYGSKTALPGPNIYAAGYDVKIIFSGSAHGPQEFTRKTNAGGFYGVETDIYVHSDHDKVTVIVENFFQRTVPWDSYARIDFLIDFAY
jgi:hypothetical protein